VIAPWREWELGSRTALIEFAKRHDIAVPVTAERPYSVDRNLFHISYEGGVLEDPWREPPAKMFLLTNDPEGAPDVPVHVELEFERGDPVAVDGERLLPVPLLTRLNRLGGEHGIGRADIVENRFRHVRGRYRVPSGGRRGVHQPERAPSQDPRPPRSRRLLGGVQSDCVRPPAPPAQSDPGGGSAGAVEAPVESLDRAHRRRA